MISDMWHFDKCGLRLACTASYLAKNINTVKKEISAVQFLRYFAVSRDLPKLKTAKYFPSLTNCLFTFIQNQNCVYKTLFFIH